MTRSNYPLRLQSSLFKEVRRLAEKEATSINQFINVAVAEKLSAMQMASYFRERAKRADIPAAIALLDGLGTEPPRSGEELEPSSVANVQLGEIPNMENSIPVTWWFELEDGGRSTVYDSRAQAEAALQDLLSMQNQISQRYSRPMRLVSSDGQKLDIPKR